MEQRSDAEFDGLRPKVRDDSTIRHYGDESIAWTPISPQPVALDPIATLLFPFFDGDASVADLVADVHHTVGVPLGVARQQLRRVLAQFDEGGLLTTSSDRAATITRYDIFHAPPNP